MIVRSTARLRYVSIPPRKMRLVGNMVKGMAVEKALNVLNFTPRIAARHIAKTVKSAAANALSIQGTDHLKPEDLVVKSVIVDSAPTAKRLRFQSMGRVYRIRKRFCHLTIHLEGEADIVAPTAGKAGKSAASDKKATVVKKTKKASAKKTAKAKSGKSKATKAKAKTSADKKTTAKAVKKDNK